MRFLRFLAFICATGLFAAMAIGYDLERNAGGYPVTWDPGTINLKLQLGATPLLSDGSTYNSSVQTAMQMWNAQINTVQLVGQVAATAAPISQNGVNEIGFNDTVYGTAFDANVLAITVYHYADSRSDGSSRMTQADIIFNTAYSWDSYRGALRASMDIQRVALHELGHVLGLNHPDAATPPQYVSALMNSAVSNLDSLTADDIQGAQSLYGIPLSAPAIFNQPGNQTQYAGQTASFTLGVRGNPTPTYQWQRLAVAGGSWVNLTDGGSYSGVLTTTLSVVAATPMNGDSFRCVATNSVGVTTSAVAQLAVMVVVPPTIAALPGNIDLVYGDVLTINASVSGTQPIVYQWKKDGVALSGSTQSSYSKSNVTTADLGQYTLTATNSAGTSTSNTVTVTVKAPLNVVGLVADPFRPRIYALQQDGINTGSLLVIDPSTALPVATLTVGAKPTDLAIDDDDNEMLVICSASQNISVVDLQTLQVTGTISLSSYGQWDVNYTSAHVKYGKGNIIYYTDGTWAPVLRVLNRTSGAVLQSIMLDGSAPNNNGGFGFGDVALTPDKSALFAWGQYGWTAGSSGSAAARFTINSDGTLALAQTSTPSYPVFSRDPLNTPVLMSADGATVFIKQYQFSTSSLLTPIQTFSGPVFAISPLGELATTTNGIYETVSGNQVYPLAPGGSPQAITADYSRLVYFDASARLLRSVDLTQYAGAFIPKSDVVPANGSLVLSPAQLKWPAVRGASNYRVYLGTSADTVANANPASPEYLGEVSVTTLALPASLPLGVTYYWRVDAVTTAGAIQSTIYHFTVETISSSVSSIDLSTVAGDQSRAIDIALGSSVPGKSWSAVASASWITLSRSVGMTPSVLTASFDTASAPIGLNQATITVTSGNDSFTLPVQFRVDPLAVTVIRSDPGSTKLYAISEDGASQNTGASRAYLLEIDAASQSISRVVRVGTGVTDLAIHKGDNRIYVTNWRIGSLLAVDIDAFTVARTYGVTPFAGIGYSTNDVYKISAGAAGRLITEAEDQWVNVSIFNTGTGVSLATISLREGGGAFDPAGRYYFHGDDDDSGSLLHKLDTAGDRITEVASVRPNAILDYYGDRLVVMSETGHRIFWDGIVFDENLVPEWTIGAIVYSASSDGRYAFGSGKIFDVSQQKILGDMPVQTLVSAFNSVTNLLVLQNGTALQFYSLPGIKLPPVIITQPMDKVAAVGESVVLSAVATGSPSPHYQWYKDGTLVGGATNATLALTGITLADAGTYQAVATNSEGSATSSGAILTVVPLPKITTQPLSHAVFSGGAATFVVVADSTPGLTYQWQRNGVNIPGATSATLSLTNIQVSDAGSYALVATNAGGSSTSRFARLVVLVPQANATVYEVKAAPTGVSPGGNVNLEYVLTNIGTRNWGSNHYLSIRDSNGTFVAFSTLIGTNSGESKPVNLTFPAPTTPGTYTYTVQGFEEGVEFFTTQTTFTLNVLAPAGNSITYNATNFPITATPSSNLIFNYNVTNTGTKSWGANHFLSLRDGASVYAQFSSLNGVEPGQSKTVNLSFTAPSAPGIYPYYVQALESGVEFFAAQADLTLTVLAPQPNAVVYTKTRSQDNVTPGATVSLRYSLSNAGTGTWGASHYASLRDNNGTFLAFVPLNGTVPGGSTTVNFSFVAPTTPGSYSYFVQALEDGVEFFDKQELVTLNVLALPIANAATYNTTTFPATAARGATVNFTLSVTNRGTKTWGANHYLALRDADSTFLGFPPLSGIAPGQSTTVNYSFTAPTSPGVYTYHVQGLEGGVEFFNEADDLVLIVP
jgi:hypothetical protein